MTGGQAGPRAGPGPHEQWLARQRFDAPARQGTYESSREAKHEISDRVNRIEGPSPLWHTGVKTPRRPDTALRA
jgi:hypothetical protein